jgi:hypothetical protein
MTGEVYSHFTEALADDVIAKLGPKIIAYLEARRVEPEKDPLLTVKEISAELGICGSKVRQLVRMGLIKKAPGISEIMCRKSVVDAYGKENPKPTKK